MGESGKDQGKIGRGLTDTVKSCSPVHYLMRGLVGLGLGFVFVWTPVHGEAIHKEGNAVVTESLEQRGKQLREAIEHAYQQMLKEKLLGPDGYDISKVVLRYIPIGTTFDDAEQILRCAGFKVEPRPSVNIQSVLPFKHDVIALIDPFVSHMTSKISVGVFLRPWAPGNYDKVYKLEAGISRSSI